MAVKLFHTLIGCTPKGRHIEQHDVFFGIAENIKELVPNIKAFWPEAKDKIHLDAWREVNYIDGYKISIVPKNISTNNDKKLFFINLGGYKPGNFIEYHFQKLIVAPSMSEAIKRVKQEDFFIEYNLPPHGHSHIDDKYALDVDDAYEVVDILQPIFKEKYNISIEASPNANEDLIKLGYFKLENI